MLLETTEVLDVIRVSINVNIEDLYIDLSNSFYEFVKNINESLSNYADIIFKKFFYKKICYYFMSSQKKFTFFNL